MPKYAVIADSERGDSFAIPTESYHINDLEHIGELPDVAVRNATRATINLARHHIISWSILRLAWNACVNQELVEVCRAMVNLLTEKKSDDMPDANDMCWARRNLIIGPLGNDRLFDPGEGIDFESPIGMEGARQVHVAAMVELGKLLEAFKDNRITKKDFVPKFLTVIKHCTKLSGDDVCIFRREEWTLAIKPVITWAKRGSQFERVGSPAAPKWHRGCYSPSSMAKYYYPNMNDPELLKRKTIELKETTHGRFIKQVSQMGKTPLAHILPA